MRGFGLARGLPFIALVVVLEIVGWRISDGGCQIAENRLQAETFDIISGNVVVEDSLLAFYGNGSAEITINKSGCCTVVVRAREDYVPGADGLVEVRFPGGCDTLQVSDSDWAEYSLVLSVGSVGDWRFSFINDYFSGEYDRNIYLDWVEWRWQGVAVPETLCIEHVCLTWDANDEADLDGYKVYYGFGSRDYVFSEDVGDTTAVCLTDLWADTTYYFAATAYDTAGNESGYSNEVFAYVVPGQASEQHKGDWNNDKIIDLLDMVAFDTALGSYLGHWLFDSVFDFEDNGIIDLLDMVQFDSVLGDYY